MQLSRLELLSRSYPGTDHATVLRGISCIMVLIIHLNCFGLTTFFKDLSQVDKCIEAFCLLGKYGPVVFFVSSGFALTASLSHSHRNFRSFLIQRIFRLWPLYVSILATAVLIEFYLYSKTFTLENLSLRLLFLDMFFPIHFYADPIHVSFSIPIEFWWSLIVFLLYLFLFSKQFFRLSVLCVAVIASCIFSSKLIQVVPGWNSFYQNFFLEFGIFFLMGFCSYHIRMLIINLKFPHYKFLVIFFAIVLVLTPIFEIDYRAAISVLAFVYLVFGNYIPSVRKKALLNLSQIPIIVGNMCYSIYLLHYPILRLFSFWFENQILIACCTLICTLVFSVISFYLIEIPFIRLGRRLAKRF